jgi:hypothetical protein
MRSWSFLFEVERAFHTSTGQLGLTLAVVSQEPGKLLNTRKGAATANALAARRREDLSRGVVRLRRSVEVA